MYKKIAQFRPNLLRFLASLLVILAVVCNGVGLAQAHTMGSMKACCAEMLSHGECLSDCDGDGKSPHENCDDQCLARCISSNYVHLAAPLMLPTYELETNPLPQLRLTSHSLAELGPGLRPPIYS